MAKAPTDQQRKKRKDDAIAAYIEFGTVTAACRAINANRATWYDWIEADEEFAAKVKHAEQAVADDLEQEAIRRAKDSSDTMLIFLLKGHKPDKFAERKHTRHSGDLSLGGVSFVVPGDDG